MLNSLGRFIGCHRSVGCVLFGMLGVAIPAISQDSADQSVAGLIERLGDPRYAQRAEAQRRLRDEGLHAFDALLDATESTDPEVAATSRRLLGEMTLGWGWLGDPPQVRNLLDSYGAFGVEERLETVRLLRGLKDEAGVPALVRISRFDLSPRGSRKAALVLMDTRRFDPPRGPQRPIAEASASLDQKYGPSRRPAARWLRLMTSPAPATPSEWRRLAMEERRRLDRNDAQTTTEAVASLRWQELRAAVRQADEGATTEAVERLISLQADRSETRLGRALEWLAEAQQWATLDRAIERHADRLETKQSLYLCARLRAEQGEEELAEDLAARAFQTETIGDVSTRSAVIDPRLRLAEGLYNSGHADWAQREYTAAGGSLEPLTVSGVIARWRLSELLQDAERYAGAAEALAALDGAISELGDNPNKYRNLARSVRNSSLLLPPTESVTARRWYYQALSLEADPEGQVAALKRAIEADPEDADILIAMHRVADPPAGFAADTRQRINTLCRQYDRAIKTNPDNAKLHNVWAWLVGNTEGDFDKAVRYSRRSLEIEPGEAGYLDTLGRCLSSAGQLDEAVEVQREAVALAPNLLVMRRQLAEFEQALAERGAP